MTGKRMRLKISCISIPLEAEYKSFKVYKGQPLIGKEFVQNLKNVMRGTLEQILNNWTWALMIVLLPRR